MLLATDKRNYGGDLTLLLRSNSAEFFGTSISAFMNRPLSGDTMYPVYNLAYLLGAIGYHCQRLAELYAHIAKYFFRITQIPGYSDKNDTCVFGYKTEPYYEFEALVSTARRSYDACRYILWLSFGQKKGTIPRSLEKLLKSPIGIPEILYHRLKISWETYGVLLTQYRDCIQHYVPVDFGLASAIMQRNSLGAWTTTLRIPDNPEVRSKEQFTFKSNRDALTYAWKIANEVLCIG